MFVRYCSPCLPMFLRCLMLMLSGPVELLFLLFLMAVCTCSVVMVICVGCSLRNFPRGFFCLWCWSCEE